MRRPHLILATLPVKLAMEAQGQKIDHEISIINSELELKVRGNFALEPGQIVEVVLNDRPELFQVAWVRPPRPQDEVEAGLELLAPLRSTA